MGCLEGRVALVTGAGQGIGRAVALRLAREGAAVTLADLNAETGRRVTEQLVDEGARAVFIATDISSQPQAASAVGETVATFGRIDILVNNAWPRRTPLRRIEDRDASDLRAAFDAGVVGAFSTMTAAVVHMRAQGGGSIVNMGSIDGVDAHPYRIDYSVAKEALRTLTRVAAREWGSDQIRCNCVCPLSVHEGNQGTYPAAMDRIVGQIPMGRMGDALMDVAGVVCFLASDDARYLTGNTLFVDGGAHINGLRWGFEP